MVDYLSMADRSRVLRDMILTNENKYRKNESLMRYEIYKSRQHPFVLEKIRHDLGQAAALKSRVISSINLTKKIINEMARVYLNEPSRTFTNLNDDQIKHVNLIYEKAKANLKLKKANRVYKLQSQSTLQVVPKDGIIEFRVLYPHHYDVIPMMNDPEQAACYIISSYDKKQLFLNITKDINAQSLNPVTNRGYVSDRINQEIADADDYQGMKLFYWWTKDYNFITDDKGMMVDKEGNPLGNVAAKDIANPIGMLPFIDIASDKDFEFFVRGDNSVTDFSLDFSSIISDVSEVNRMQGFAQAIITSQEEPKDLKIGPRNYTWLKLPANAENGERPSFSFASPNPDLNASLAMLQSFISFFLTSLGQSPKTINSMGSADDFTSGVDRFLSMLDKFEASKDDVDMFKLVEKKAYELIIKWNNLLSNVTDNGFIPELAGVMIPEDSEIDVKFNGPEVSTTEKEKLDVIQQKRELGMMSRVEAVMLDRGIDEPAAQKIIDDIDASDGMPAPQIPTQIPPPAPLLPSKQPLKEV